MRVSTFQIHQQASKQMETLGAQVAATQERISHGKRLTAPSDDPIGAARLVDIRQELGARKQFAENIAAADAALLLEDSILNQTTELIHRVQELTLQAGSGIQTHANREYLAAEIQARFDELMALANTKNAAGQYVFSGFQGREAPFEARNGEVAYQGDNGQRRIAIDRGQLLELNDAGQAVFMDVQAPDVRLAVTDSNSSVVASQIDVVDQAALDDFFPDDVVVRFNDNGGAMTYTVVRSSDQRPLEGLVDIPYSNSASLTVAGVQIELHGTAVDGDQLVLSSSNRQSLFSTVQGIAEGLRDINESEEPEEFRALIDSTIVGLNNATDVILRTRADIGARMNSLQAASAIHDDVTLQLESVRSGVEDLDFAAAVSDLAYQSFVLEAAQQSFIRINGLSLFQRL